ncbi:MAG: aminoacyl-tRNA hydrolase [Gammaproteobacteria bacterium]|nr:aminoacyl-tRNA hydrolase [Gammaproteobacteria bacterium]
MIQLTNHIAIDEQELEWHAIRAQGSGGQNVNKVSSAVHLRFDIKASSLPEECRQRLLASGDRRITADGVLIIKAQRFRSQEKNLADAIARLAELVSAAAQRQKKRVATRPGAGARQRRLDIKQQQGKTKMMRRRPGIED